LQLIYNTGILAIDLMLTSGYFYTKIVEIFLSKFEDILMPPETAHEELKEKIKALGKELAMRKNADEALRLSEEKYRNIISSIEDGYYEVNLYGNLTFFNDSLCRLYGSSRDEFMGMNNREYMSEETAKKTYEVYNRVYQTGEPAKIFDYEFIKKNGTIVDVEVSVSLIRDSEGQAIGFRGILRDISERKRARIALEKANQQLEAANKELEQLACMDGLTQIPNRRFFNEYLEKEWQRLAREQDSFALILSDIDHFKQYNDTYGHLAGDDCLKKIAQGISNCLRRPADRVSRYGGEEFVIVLPHTDLDGAVSVAESIQAEIAQLKIPHEQSTAGQYVTLSLGVSCTVPDNKQRPQALVKTADQALYQAKESGRNQVISKILED